MGRIKINGAYFRRFWVKEPSHSKTFFAKKRYTSIVALVYFDAEILHLEISMPYYDAKPSSRKLKVQSDDRTHGLGTVYV